MKSKLISLLLLCCFFTAFKADKPKITVFMIGDSTMANKSLEGGNPERGWGHVLPGFFTEDIQVDNHAQNGRSSRSFINEGRWDKVLSLMKPGDYLFIQFGHNDEKPKEDRHTDPGTTFDENLRRFVLEARAKGGIPVLFNSIVRRNYVNGVLTDTHGAYLDSPRNVAKELNVPFVDMNRITHDLVVSMGEEDSKKLFTWLPANQVMAKPKGLQDNTHLNVYGARVIASLTIDAIAKEVPALAKYVRHYDLVVAKDGSGDFFTVQEAINAVPDFRKEHRTTILIRPGVYKEKLIVPASKINLSLIGQQGAVLSYDDYASKPNRFGENKGTSGSASCYIYAPDFYAENLTFENSAGLVGQAVACFVSADRAFFKQCRFLGFQDTLYTYGKGCRQYYEDCYIEGTVDFIFGWSTAVFNRCEIRSKRSGYVAAPSTDKEQPYGYLFYECRLTAGEGVQNVFLARPWRPYGQAVYARCQLGGHIAPAGWNNWGKQANEKSARFAEYQNTGEGAGTSARAKFARQLKSLKGYEPEAMLAGSDGWNPIKNGNTLLTLKR
ncbi:MAG: GDSL-type esterase/lipase family protein [Prevotellaceae bacterium]|jgi:pectinesterase|nr:GDSL-type esterase/lipase family protein [Prevotellaceae bacterium]